ncbi:linker for activation of T-cells family member 1 isoform X2 [Paroedura picta]|uniref:linker for activation of T-cells family member 1 isoform X2 n=1 Tax=Paroedura picta TaxID=143630 RepID=UPI0040575462
MRDFYKAQTLSRFPCLYFSGLFWFGAASLFNAALQPGISSYPAGMDTFQTDASFLVWLLTLTVPTLVVLLVVCIGCRDPESDTLPIDDYQYKPHSSGQLENFRVLRPNPSSPWAPAQRQPILPRTTATRYPLGPPYARTASSGCPQQDPPRPPAPFDTDNEDNESIPSYVNEEQHCATDEDENYFPGYIEVLPDAPVGDKENENGASTGSLGDQYENMPESTASSQHSLGEYVNVLEPDPIIVDLCAAGSSDLESEEDTPDYENIIRPRD